MQASFHTGNRQNMYASMLPGSIALIFAGHAPLKTGDEPWPFFAERNFVYLTGLCASSEGFILMAVKNAEGETKESLFILPPDLLKERWTGRRVKPDEATTISGIEDIRFLADFETDFHKASASCCHLYLDLGKLVPTEQDNEAYIMARKAAADYPHLQIHTLRPQLRKQRTIKQPCEIEALRVAEDVTRDGILAMMKAAKPGITEYQLKAEYDYALAQRGVLTPGFPSIISCGDNNFCIHYYAYTGTSKDGDMVLNDVGAVWDGMICDVSRGWPVNGRFSEKQRQLYTCVYNTSNYMFSIIKPGMRMGDVDLTARKYNFEQLKGIGLLDDYKDIGKYMWHGGSHHIGYDVHDIVDYRPDLIIEPGMVFCVDIGVYVEEWGIGFRLEDNCLVTENGCENLSAAIPRSIEDIEAFMNA